jgi:hypothetical protein
MEKIYLHWKVCFFTEAILVMLLIAALWVSLKHRKKYVELKFFPLYIGCLLIVFASVYSSLFSPIVHYFTITKFNFVNYIDYFFILIELFIFTNYFLKIITNKRVKKTLFIIAIAFIPYFFSEMYFDKYFPRSISERSQSRVYTVESLILLFPCFIYFYELFKKAPILDLKNEPSFWIVTGWSFFATCTLPYSLMENYLRDSHSTLMTQLYSVFYIFYTLLFTLVIRAYLCKRSYI